MIQPPEASAFLTWSFALLGVALAIGFVWLGHVAGRRQRLPRAENARLTLLAATFFAVWLAVTWIVAASGVVAEFDRRPPPIVFLLLAILLATVALSWSRVGTRLIRGLPLWVLVLTQSFRLPLELMMHEAAIEGVMPVQMSYSGRNLDILTGITAVPVAWLLAKRIGGRRLAAVWNLMGTLLLVNIVSVALLSTPTFAYFGP